jgi:hypothetical protein
MRRIRSVVVAVALAASMLVAAAGPAQAPEHGTRECDNWYFRDSGLDYRFSHCSNPYFVQDVVKAHARLHLYYWSTSADAWRDPSSVDSITINEWNLYVGIIYARAPQSRGSGPPYHSFYSAGIGLACGALAASSNWDESVRLANGHAHYGPGDSSEIAISPNSARPNC